MSETPENVWPMESLGMRVAVSATLMGPPGNPPVRLPISALLAVGAEAYERDRLAVELGSRGQQSEASEVADTAGNGHSEVGDFEAAAGIIADGAARVEVREVAPAAGNGGSGGGDEGGGDGIGGSRGDRDDGACGEHQTEEEKRPTLKILGNGAQPIQLPTFYDETLLLSFGLIK